MTDWAGLGRRVRRKRYSSFNCIFASFVLLLSRVCCQELDSLDPILPFFTLFNSSVNTYPLFGTEKIWILRREWPEKWTLDIEIEPDNDRHRKSGLFRIKKQSRTQEFIYSLDWNFSRQKTVLYVDDRRIVFSKAPRKFLIAFGGDSAFLYYGCAKVLKGYVLGNAKLSSPVFSNAHLVIGAGQAKNTEFHGKIHEFSFYDSAEVAFNLAQKRFCIPESNSALWSLEGFMASEAYEETVAFKRKQTNTASLRSNPLLGMF